LAICNINDPRYDAISRQCLLKIQSVYASLKTAERKAVEFLLNYPDVFSSHSIQDIAIKADCSQATLIRIARKLGYAGFPDLKASLLRADDDKLRNYTNISVNDSVITVSQKVFDSSVLAIQDTFALLDNIQFEQALQSLLQANTILLAGEGDASISAHALFLKLCRLGTNVKFSFEYDVQLMAVSQLKKGDTLLVISHSGQTGSTFKLVKCAKAQGATVIAITKYPYSPIGKNADIVLQVAVFVHDIMGEILSKRVTELCIVESLYVNYFIRKGRDQAILLQHTDEVLKKNNKI